MEILSAEFVVSNTKVEKCPQDNLPEYAFIGRSNVGKSSLINMLTKRPKLAMTSSTPGKTLLINHFQVNKEWYLVDLPGYGYAKAGEEIKAKWGVMIENYLHTSKQLRAVFLLIDIRHEPSDNDCLMYEWMVEQGFAPIIIATKSDKIARGKIHQHVEMIKRVLQVEPETVVIPFSAETKDGKDKIWELVDELVGYVGEEKMEEVIASMNPDREDEPEVPKKKERWKKTNRPVAKKTAKKKAAMKAGKKK